MHGGLGAGEKVDCMEIQCEKQACGGEVGSEDYYYWEGGLWIVTRETAPPRPPANAGWLPRPGIVSVHF